MLQAASRVPARDSQALKVHRIAAALLAHLAAGSLVAGLLIGLVVSTPVVWRLILGQTVYLSVDGHSHSYNTLGRTVADVLEENKITLDVADRVIPPSASAVWPGMQIIVLRAVPVTIVVGGIPQPALLAAQTVGEGLGLLHVQVRPGDRVFPDPSTALTPQMRVTVERREVRTWVERSTVPFPSLVVGDPGLYKWVRVVRSAGQVGVRERTVRVQYADGRAVSVQTIADTIARRPVPRIIAIGSRPRIAARGPYSGREIMLMVATGYYPGPLNYGGGVGTRTAIGLRAGYGVVAVDPSVIPLRTHLHIEGYGDAVAGDTGGAIRGDRIDLGFDTYAEAMQFGRRHVTVYLLPNP